MHMLNAKLAQKPEADTGTPMMAATTDGGKTTATGLWDIEQLMAHVPVCRRSIHNLRKKGLPTIVLGRRLFWHPPSVESWLLRQQKGQP
jgi:hypothetical protein